MSVPRVLVSPEALETALTVLSGPELRHLRVRRVRVGKEVVLTDGQGHERHGVVIGMQHHRATIRLTDRVAPQRDSPLRLVLAQAALKHDKLDLVIEKATELGASELWIFLCDRTVTRVASDRRARWERVARSAAKQCQRSTVPVVVGPLVWADLLGRETDARRLLFWEGAGRAGLAALAESNRTASSVLAVVGPEGGFSSREVESARAAGFSPIRLSPRILRAETAALVVVTLCQFLWGDLGGASAQT